MYRRLLGAGLLVVMFLSLGAPATWAQKPDKKPAAAPTDADTLPPGESSGKLKSVPGTDGTFTVGVEYQHLELKNPKALAQFQKANPQLTNAIRDQQKIAQTQAHLATARTPQQAAHYLQQLQHEMASIQTHQLQALTRASGTQNSPYTLKTETKDITFHAAEDVKVRFTNPPSAFDEKGNVKKYTPEELKELKGKDTNLPGYQGSVEKLSTGMTVKVTTKKAPPKKDADKDKDDAKPEEHKTVVTLIVVQGDESSGTGSGDQPKKPKK